MKKKDRVCWLVGVRDFKPGLVALFPTHSRSQNKRKVSFFGGGRKRTELSKKEKVEFCAPFGSQARRDKKGGISTKMSNVAF